MPNEEENENKIILSDQTIPILDKNKPYIKKETLTEKDVRPAVTHKIKSSVVEREFTLPIVTKPNLAKKSDPSKKTAQKKSKREPSIIRKLPLQKETTKQTELPKALTEPSPKPSQPSHHRVQKSEGRAKIRQTDSNYDQPAGDDHTAAEIDRVSRLMNRPSTYAHNDKKVLFIYLE